ncbi:MAG: molybdopterin molybdotransferase MoeA [Woeseiaceae bacterium]|nr:molybdopterin molybdotransferase MoeA [Woeseiaceae bacterium]
MLTVAEASLAIADAMPAIDVQTIPLADAPRRILRQVVTAERDQPPFDRVTMDGIAINFAAWENGARAFNIQGIQHAGDPVMTLETPANCIEIMTGSVLPKGADCVIAVERLDVQDGVATVEEGYKAKHNQFIHPQGSDYRDGDVILEPGSSLSPMDIAIVASCGLAEVTVNCQPSISVISTGNELIPPGAPIEPHQVRLSNGPALVAMLVGHGFSEATHEHIEDDPERLRNRLSGLLSGNDVLILSGGVSMGKADFVPGVLASLDVEVVFHKISQRPGKPMWFGIGPNKQTVFALPGNPVSSLVCCRQYVLPALFQTSGHTKQKTEMVALAEDIQFNADLTCFQPVRLGADPNGIISAVPVKTNTSGDFAALSGTDGYVELARQQNEFAAGTVVPLHRWKMP